MSRTPDRFCANCGFKRPLHYTFCGRCGTKFATFKANINADIPKKTIPTSIAVIGAAFAGIILFFTIFSFGVLFADSLNKKAKNKESSKVIKKTKTDTSLPKNNSRTKDNNQENLKEIPNPKKLKQIVGKVVGISDGDTILVLDKDKTQHKIRLQGIDAPESSQAFGQKSKQSLSNLAFGKQVTILIYKKDKYKRLVGTIYIDGEDINLRQIKNGFAWHYKKYSKEQTVSDRKLYETEEKKSRSSKAGLWRESNAIAPWDFRNGKADSNRNKSAIPNGTIIGNRNSNIYHWRGCPNYFDVSPGNRVLFNSTKDAERAGFRAARNCRGSAPVSKNSLDYSRPKSIPKAKKKKRSIPAGASARCRDGTLSYSRSRRGTCSHHGGVAVWF